VLAAVLAARVLVLQEASNPVASVAQCHQVHAENQHRLTAYHTSNPEVLDPCADQQVVQLRQVLAVLLEVLLEVLH